MQRKAVDRISDLVGSPTADQEKGKLWWSQSWKAQRSWDMGITYMVTGKSWEHGHRNGWNDYGPYD